MRHIWKRIAGMILALSLVMIPTSAQAQDNIYQIFLPDILNIRISAGNILLNCGEGERALAIWDSSQASGGNILVTWSYHRTRGIGSRDRNVIRFAPVLDGTTVDSAAPIENHYIRLLAYRYLGDITLDRAECNPLPG